MKTTNLNPVLEVKRRHAYQLMIFVALSLSMVAFQNAAFKDFSKMTLQEVDETSRQLHAKELLGKYYKKSAAFSAENLPYFNIHIFNRIEEGLPKAFKKKAPQVAQMILTEAEKHDFDPAFVLALIQTESGFNPLAIGSVGEIGLMQIRPQTAEWIAKKEKIKWLGPQMLKDPAQNVRLGIAYLSFLRDLFENKAYKYLSAYNVGPGKLRKLIGQDTLPKIYSTKVMKYYEEFYQRIAVYSKIPNLAAI
jgi:soluble lytic murein transglycosylase